MNETEIEFKLENVRKIWQRFLYRDSILLEAERQKTAFGNVEDWAVQLLQLSEDDVFATLIQVYLLCQIQFSHLEYATRTANRHQLLCIC